MMKRFIVLLLSLLTLAAPAFADVTVNGQLKKAQLEKLSADPTGSTARVYYNTTDNVAKYYNGSAWKTIMDTTTALTAPVVSNYVDYTEIATPSSPSSGKLRVYSKSDDKLYTLTSAGIEQAVGSGTGSGGGTNYISNPSGASNTTGYTPSGTMTVTRVTSGLPRATTTGTGLSLAAGSAGDYVQTCFTIDSVDKSKKLGFSWAQAPSSYTDGDMKAEVYSFTSSSCGGTATALQIDQGGSNKYYSVPNVSGVIPLSFDTTTADYYGIRYTRVTGTSTLVVSDVTVTPDRNTVVGQAGGYLGNLASQFTLSAGFGTTASVRFDTWRINNVMRVHGYLSAGTTAASTASLTLPAGYTMDSTALSSSGSGTQVGTWVAQDPTATNIYAGNTAGIVFYDGSTTGTLYFAQKTGTSSGVYDKTNVSSALSSNMAMDIWFDIPIAEWAGSTVNIGQNGPECAYNTGNVTSAGGSDTTSFGYGTAGTPILSYNSTTPTNSTSFKVEFLNPIQPGERTDVEVSTGTGPYWFDISAVGINQSRQGTSLYGVSIAPVDSRHVTVLFNNGGYASTPATYAGNGAAWSGLSTWKWRSCRVPASQATGFAEVIPGKSAGLVGKDGLKGRTDGVGPCTGCIGELIENNRGTSLALTTGVIGTMDSGASTWADSNATGITLQAGIYDINGHAGISCSNGTTVSNVDFFISTAKNSSTGVDTPRAEYQWAASSQTCPASGCAFYGPVGTRRAILTSPATYYLTGVATFSGSCTGTGNISARRVY